MKEERVADDNANGVREGDSAARRFELVIGIGEARALTSIDKLYAECFDVSISVFPVRAIHIVMLFIGLSH
ncbi:hypothetical protein [Caballeronia sp. J97]|uniref:hypothetical protein n=1 Tax=Caballeronia sp. J97 TaxID=2805429 RepID=UPI002AAF35A0|nr:hypothetical protein [Caballeronia sp. J97]